MLKKHLDKIWHLGLLYTLSELKFSISSIKFIRSFFLRENSELRWKVKCLCQRIYKQGCHEVPSCPHSVQYIYIYINDTPQTPGVYLGLFADDTCIYATDRKESYVLRKLQRGLSAIETWCERWNIKVNVDKAQDIYFSHRLRAPQAHLHWMDGISPLSVT
jgi:hypothetical protein